MGEGVCEGFTIRGFFSVRAVNFSGGVGTLEDTMVSFIYVSLVSGLELKK